MQNSLCGKELNEFCPLSSSDDLCLFFVFFLLLCHCQQHSTYSTTVMTNRIPASWPNDKFLFFSHFEGTIFEKVGRKIINISSSWGKKSSSLNMSNNFLSCEEWNIHYAGWMLPVTYKVPWSLSSSECTNEDAGRKTFCKKTKRGKVPDCLQIQ